jgi:hypothetical protein
MKRTILLMLVSIGLPAATEQLRGSRELKPGAQQRGTDAFVCQLPVKAK